MFSSLPSDSRSLLGTSVDKVFGFPRFHSTATLGTGRTLLIAGFPLRVWAAYHFDKHRMNVIVLSAQSHLITAGPYRFSRNPPYLGGNVFIFFGSDDALLLLVVPHTFRYVGLSFLVPGVVSPSLAPAFAEPAAYGDLGAAILAITAVLSIKYRAPWVVPLVWLFNLWGMLDLLNAIYQGQIGVGIGPGLLGAAFFIPTVILPALLITHGLIFRLLLRPRA